MAIKQSFILFFYPLNTDGGIMEHLISQIVEDKISLANYESLNYDDKIDYIYNLKEDEDALLKYEVENTVEILKENYPDRNIKDIRMEIKEYFEKDENQHNEIIMKIYKSLNKKIRDIYENIKKPII